MDFKTTLEKGNVIKTPEDHLSDYLKRQLQVCDSLSYSELLTDLISTNKHIFTQQQLRELRSVYSQRRRFYLTEG